MALQPKSGNIRMDRTVSSLKPNVNMALGNENMLTGKIQASNVSKIPIRSALGLVNDNVPKASDFKKPSAPQSLLNHHKVNSTSKLRQNVSQAKVPTGVRRTQSTNRSALKPIAPNTVESARAVAVVPPLVPQKPAPAKRALRRIDSTASVRLDVSNDTQTADIEQCEVDLNNVSLEEDVDKADVGDPFLLGDYVRDIFNHLFDLEDKYMIKENFLKDSRILPKYRAILVDYMVDMQMQYVLFPETLFLAVYMVDKFLELEPTLVTKSNLQCVGVSAMYLASKYEEIVMPDIHDFSSLTDNSVSVKDILSTEVLIVKALNFDFNRPNPLAFLRRFSKVTKAEKLIHSYSKYFIELAVNDYTCVHEKPSKVAAASLYLAHVVNKTDMRSFWSRTLIHYTRYTEADIMPVVHKLARAVLENTENKYRAIKEKYAKTGNSRVSVRPALQFPSTALRALAAKASQ